MVKKETIERITLKLPKSIADYFRKEFPHGKRSQFVKDMLREHKHNKEVKRIEEDLRIVNKKRR